MSHQHLRPRSLPLIVLAGFMIVASLFAAAPAEAAKGHASIYIYCISNGPQTTPGYALNCQAGVQGFPAPTGSLTISAASYKGTLSTTTCSFLSYCPFTYTPIGKGSSYRTDTVTAHYSGDSNYYSGTASTKIKVTASPPIGLTLSCPASTPTGVAAYCLLSMQTSGPTQYTYVDLKVPTYKGAVSPSQCGLFQGMCGFAYIPKGRGYDSRVDTITASYAGDLFNGPNKVTAKIHVSAAP